MDVPNYCNIVAVKNAFWRIGNPGRKNYDNQRTGQLGERNLPHYEHHVGCWSFTVLKHLFSDEKWVITPESIVPSTRKRPDLLVEKLENPSIRPHYFSGPQPKFIPHLYLENKKHNGASTKTALYQTAHFLPEHMEGTISCFIITVCGMKIGFFEFHNLSEFDDENVPNFESCISLTDDCEGRVTKVVDISQVPQDGDVYTNQSTIQTLEQGQDTSMPQEYRGSIQKGTSKYTHPCVFDIRYHEDAINRMFHFVLTNEPRDLF